MKTNYHSTKIWDRQKKKFIYEREFGAKSLDFLYHTLPGRLLLKYLVSRPVFSRIQAVYHKAFLSKKDIAPFIKKYNIDMRGFSLKYASFNDFFIRKKTSPCDISQDKNIFLSCADAKLSVYRIKKDMAINVKGTNYTLKELLHDDIPPWLEGGSCIIYRLSMSDCHRYIFSADGHLDKQRYIRGSLHSVRRTAAHSRGFASNSRVINYINTDSFQKIIQIEVGALLVGHIVNHKTCGPVYAGEEKGYFEFGGSAIIQFLDKCVIIDKDLIRNCAKGIETKITAGERIAYACGVKKA